MSNEDEVSTLFSGAAPGIGINIPKDLSGADKILHADDAVDFGEEDELAEDELPEEEFDSPGMAALDDTQDDWAKELALEAEPDTPNAQQVSPKVQHAQKSQEQTQEDLDLMLLQVYYPSFKPHSVLKMHTLFGPKVPKQPASFLSRSVRPLVPTRLKLDTEGDTVVGWRSQVYRPAVPAKHIVRVEPEVQTNLPAANSTAGESQSDKKYQLIVSTSDWDYILDDPEPKRMRLDEREQDEKEPDIQPNDIHIYMQDIYNSDEEDGILSGSYSLTSALKLDMNDPHLLFANDTSKMGAPKFLLQSRYNVSNDRAYDLLKENYQNKVRSTIGNLNIDHSLVALRLQSPFYKVSLSKLQTRSWHRPKFNVKPGQVISFSPLKSHKKKKDKNKHITQLLARSSDLTLGDNCPMFLMEYSEEFPLVLNSFGMGSKLINYYRKKSPEDSARPKLPLGETHVLDTQDRSAFWNFGFVEPGKVVPTLYNQMIRAPVFQHEPKKTDFLLIRSSNKARGQRYFLRPLKYLFAIGQTFPVTLIPGPHSRKVTTASKNRLKMIVYRILNKDHNHRLQVKDISPHFPDQNDMQNRQRLKEFMEYQRSGDDQGFWKIKQGDMLPTEETIRSMIQPEDIALLEVMQVGQQRLEDSGYGKTVDDDKEDQDGMSLEEQLAPWNIARNFINAIQGKAMLQLHGDGDPTARGEGFSFLRTSMKGGFKAMNESANQIDKSKLGGHSYNVALQQKAYDQEVKRIWYSQARSLRITDPKLLPPGNKSNGDDPSTNLTVEDNDDVHGSNQKVLRITRMLKDENDVVVRQTEIVTDPNVIHAYMKRRQTLEDAQMAPDDISLTNDEERNRRNRRILEEELARLKRNQDRRLARKANKGDGKSGAKIKSTTRKCATCGAVGHIKTNKSCPMYNDIYFGGQAKVPPASTPMAPELP